MSYNGSGVYTLPGAALVNGEIVSATENNQSRNDFASALNIAWCRDGQAPATANIPMGSHKFTGLAAGTTNGDSVRYEQVTSAVAITGGTIDGTTIGATTPSTGVFTDLTVNSNLKVPVGTTSQRSSTPANGMIRYNTTIGRYEGASVVSGVSISTITHVSTTATLTTSVDHGLSTGDYVTISGASSSEYNGSYSITKINATQFSYVMATAPASNATVVGSYTATLWYPLPAQDSLTGAVFLPVGTVAQRPAIVNTGYIRFNSDYTKFEGYNGTAWTAVGGGATGGGNDDIFALNGQTVTVDYTIPSGKNAMSAGPITVNSGITVTIPSGSYWTIV